MIQEILASRGIVPIPCDLQCLDMTTIKILTSNPTDGLDEWAVRLRSGEVVLLIPDAGHLAWLFVDADDSTWIIGPDGDRTIMTRDRIESRIDDPLRIRR